MSTAESPGPEPRTSNTPTMNGARANPGRFCTTRPGSPKVPGTVRRTSRSNVRRVRLVFTRRPRTMISFGDRDSASSPNSIAISLPASSTASMRSPRWSGDDAATTYAPGARPSNTNCPRASA